MRRMDDAHQIPGPREERGAAAEYIGVYRLRSRLGRGGMGEVFLAHDDRLERPVAIKRIRSRAEASQVDRERFRREARAVAKLNHPAITQVYDVVYDEAGDAIVMEYVRGRTLAELIPAGDLDAEGASSVAVQVAEGLAEAHAKGFVHRDLKAENVMVTPEGQAKILDFGLAKPLASDESQPTLTETGAVVGTFSTLSPEQAAGEPVDARSDLFSFGVLLYEMFTGHSPFRRRNRMLSLQSVLADRPPPPRALRPELPAALSDLIEELLAKNPEQRPASAAEVGSRLRESSGDLAGIGAPQAAGSADHAAVRSDAATRSEAVGVPQRHARSRARAEGDGASLPFVPLRGTPPRRRIWRLLATLFGLAVLGVIGSRFLLREKPLYVLLAPPDVVSAEVSELVVVGVVDAVFGYLNSLEGVVPIDHSGADAEAIEDLVREEAADEVLRTRIDCPGPGTRCEISFSRWRGNRRLGGVERIEIIDPEDYRTFAGNVKIRLREAYPGRGARSGTPALKVGDGDYRIYLGLRRQTAAGKNLDDAGFEELLGVARRSPRFLAGVLLAANIARTREDWDRALELVREARRLAPADPRPLAHLVHVELGRGEIEAAERALEELGDLDPGSELTLRSRIRLLQATGRREEAADAARQLVRGRASWLNLWYLADAERALGRSAAARAALENLLEISPHNQPGLQMLAELETTFGEPARAEKLWRQLLDTNPRGIYYSNLGWVLYLQGRYGEAAETHQKAVAQDPRSPHRLLNLALAEEASGRRAAAQEIYHRLRDQLDDDHIGKAQCLVRLGRASEAVKVAARVLESQHGSLNVRYQAAQVFALAGERHSARAQVEILLEHGYASGWFRIPAFESLAGDAAFEDLLRRFGSS